MTYEHRRPFSFSRRQMLAGALVAPADVLRAQAAWATELGVAPAPKTVGQGRANSRERVKHNVFFVTNRRPTGSIDLRQQFNSDRGQIVYGCATVLVAPDRRWRQREVTEPRSMQMLSRAELASAIKRKPGRRAIIAIHGYNNDFNSWLCTGTELIQDLQTESNVFLVSWSSQGYALGYPRDVNEVEWATEMISELVVDLLSHADVASVQIIGHSIGCRAVVKALKDIFASVQRPLLRRLSNLVLAAPDVETAIVDRDFVPIRDAFEIDTTIYASNKDIMMALSEFWNGQPRAGSVADSIYVRPRIITIDVSAVDDTLMGHSVFFSSDRIINDLHYLLEARLPVERRFHLQPVSIVNGMYWVMTP